MPKHNIMSEEDSKTKVLIVDDEKDLTDMLALNLNAKGYDAHALNDPTQILKVARDFMPDVIVLDFIMPGMDGGDVLSTLKRHPDFHQTPVLFVSALASTDEGAEGEGAPADEAPATENEESEESEGDSDDAAESGSDDGEEGTEEWKPTPALEAGKHAIIPKPVKIDYLIERIEGALREERPKKLKLNIPGAPKE